MTVTLGVALGDVDIIGVLPTAGEVCLILQTSNYVIDLQDYMNNGFVVSSVDLGNPTIKESVSDLPGVDGQFDQTQNFGPRTVVLSGAGDITAMTNKLAPYLAPGARPTLIYNLVNGEDIKQLTLRVGQWSNPVTNPNQSQWQVQWVASDPIALSTTQKSVNIAPGSDDGGSGRAYSRTYPRVYPATFGGSGIGLVPVGGNFVTWPLLRIYGPITNPIIEWLGSDGTPLGFAVTFADFTIGVGDYLDIDTKAKTALLNSDPEADRFNFLDFANTDFGPLQPASTNSLRFSGSDINASTVMDVFYSDAYIQ